MLTPLFNQPPLKSALSAVILLLTFKPEIVRFALVEISSSEISPRGE
ncbi:hypothetical protein ES703_80112 [subsurface metagenome]